MIRPLVRGADLIGRPIVDASTGDDVAEVRDVVFDAARGEVTQFTLRRRGFLGRRLKEVLDMSDVIAVGTDAVIIRTSEDLGNPSESQDDRAPDPGGEVIGDRVLTESGRFLGTLKDVIIMTGARPLVVGFEVHDGPLGDGLIPMSAARSLSGSSLIVPDIFGERIHGDLVGLAAELTLLSEGSS